MPLTTPEESRWYRLSKADYMKLDRAGRKQARWAWNAEMAKSCRESTDRVLTEAKAAAAIMGEEARKERDQRLRDRLVAELKAGYFNADPTATVAEFDKALPGLLERHREQATLGQHDALKRQRTRL